MSHRPTQARDKAGSQSLSSLLNIDNIIATVHRLCFIELSQNRNFKYMCILKQTGTTYTIARCVSLSKSICTVTKIEHIQAKHSMCFHRDALEVLM